MDSRAMFWTRGRCFGLEVDVLDSRSMFWTCGRCSKLKIEVVDLRPTMFRFEAEMKADVYIFLLEARLLRCRSQSFGIEADNFGVSGQFLKWRPNF